ncbi:hypothetical protein [Tahibacter amnicola]|uniref:DUF5666 domain-containing protein n=1 Tax=Tahibacter amnicola TaxID=2976241 RepID=A0ABY6B9R0_9GAMM|nr:hypothetical protein [Tahibacter amnicola]UXI65863.1 hypothetical protein N4264_13950 [Tahibacter amnicola]
MKRAIAVVLSLAISMAVQAAQPLVFTTEDSPTDRKTVTIQGDVVTSVRTKDGARETTQFIRSADQFIITRTDAASVSTTVIDLAVADAIAETGPHASVDTLGKKAAPDTLKLVSGHPRADGSGCVRLRMQVISAANDMALSCGGTSPGNQANCNAAIQRYLAATSSLASAGSSPGGRD